jgi:transcriptional regulator with XRE-family HTH domain
VASTYRLFTLLLINVILIDIRRYGQAMSLKDYRVSLHWSAEELARRAGVNAQTVRRIERGSPAYLHTAQAIVDALSEGLGRKVTIDEVGIKIRIS